MTRELDTVVFDLGNVLIEWDRRNLFGKLIDDPRELDHFLDEVFTIEDNVRLDKGTPLQAVADGAIARSPEKADLISVLVDRWEEMLGPVIEGTVDILEELSRNDVRLLALSNWGRDTFERIESNYPFFKLFDGMVISGYEGVVKPDREIFEVLCDRHQVDARRAVFVDDSIANVEASKSLGFDGLLFETPARLREQLIARGFI